MAVNIDDLLRRAVQCKASDLHIKVGNHPYLRVDGLLHPLSDVPRITPEEMLAMAFGMMSNPRSRNSSRPTRWTWPTASPAWAASASTSSSSAATSGWCCA